MSSPSSDNGHAPSTATRETTMSPSPTIENAESMVFENSSSTVDGSAAADATPFNDSETLPVTSNNTSAAIPRRPLTSTTPPTSVDPVVTSATLSPLRNPTIGPVGNNGQFSTHADEGRNQLRNDLKGKVHFATKSENFWNNVLETDSVPTDTVTAIQNAIQSSVGTLVRLSRANNPQERDMYKPLTQIFESVKNLSTPETQIPRFWKDHHAHYPGVDSGVLVSGLEDQIRPTKEGESTSGEAAKALVTVDRPPIEVGVNRHDPIAEQWPSEDGTSDISGPPTKRRRIERSVSGYRASSEDGSVASEDDMESDPSYNPSAAVASRLPRKSIGSHFVPKSSSNLTSGPPGDQRVFDARKPDWILLDADSKGNIPEAPLWRHMVSAFELKPESSMAPNKNSLESSLIVQCTDYARLHLSLRPFQRFSINFTLCGKLFNAWLTDRAGVIISPTLDLKKTADLEIFVRTLVQVTTKLNAHQLGMDPTVKLDGSGSMGDAVIPRFVVRMPSDNVYITRGIPIWQSSSIFGRGTVVWSVELETTTPGAAKGQNPVSTNPTDDLILKTAYRNKDRIGESEFYHTIQLANAEGIKGLAVFQEGGDIFYDEERPHQGKERTEQVSTEGDHYTTRQESNTARLVSVGTHRAAFPSSFSGDLIAHRLVLKSKGRRLTECESLTKLLEVVLAGVQAHESLYNMGILHRDISVGNVFMSSDLTAGATHGFLADLDMAKVYDKEKLSKVVGEQRAEQLVKTTTSGSVVGTAQFMSLALLDLHATRINARRAVNLLNKPIMLQQWEAERRKKAKKASIVECNPEDPKHDLESFIWVMLYALCAKEMNSQTSVGAKKQYFDHRFVWIFGALSFEDTWKAHLSIAHLIQKSDEDTYADLSKATYVEDPIAWYVLRALMDLSQEGDGLTHTNFKNMLGELIGLLKDPRMVTVSHQ